MTSDAARYLTAAIPGVGGRIKERPEDFLVEEQPLYQPSGAGEHIYLLLEKRNVSTLAAARVLAKHFGVPLNGVGFAGLKDKRAITRQVFSIHTPGKKPEDFPMLQHAGMAVQWVDLHENKLRKGHLIGNRFSIRIRGVDMTKALAAKRGLEMLERMGVPNRFGEQRFGFTGRNHLVGRALILDEREEAVEQILGPRRTGETFEDAQEPARRLYAEGKYAEAMQAFGFSSRTERRILMQLARGEKPRRCVHAIERPELEFYLSAFQSAVFNDVLDRRMEAGGLDRLEVGDVACKEPNRAMFAVGEGDLGEELTERLRSLEVSPTGPMWAGDMMRAGGKAAEAEVAALERFGVEESDLLAFEARRPNRMPGARRPMRVKLEFPDVEGGLDEHGSYVRVAFDLPRGAFATEVLREIMKPASEAALRESDEDEEADRR